MARSASCTEATSALIANASAPISRIRFSTSLSASSFRPTQTTFAPAFAKVIAHACPIPDVAPVTKATLPVNCLSFIFSVPFELVTKRYKKHKKKRQSICASCAFLWHTLTAQSQKADYYHPEEPCEAIPECGHAWRRFVGKQLSRSIFPENPAISFACSG